MSCFLRFCFHLCDTVSILYVLGRCNKIARYSHRWYNKANMIERSTEGASSSLFDTEKSLMSDLIETGHVTRMVLQQRIADNQRKATAEIRALDDSEGHGTPLSDWNDYYRIIDWLHDRMVELPEDATVPSVDQAINEIETIDQMNALYENGLTFPRLGTQAIKDAYGLLTHSTKITEVVIAATSDDAVVDAALQVIPTHRRAALTHDDLSRAPVIHEVDGNLVHYRYGVALWQTPQNEE